MPIRARRRSSELSEAVRGSLTEADLERIRTASDETIEARGTFCPEPVIRTQNRMRDAPPGTVAMLLADDAGVEIDIPAWCLSTGNEYLGILRARDHLCVFVRRR